MKEIPLTQGYVALVDDDDYEWLSQWSWCVKDPHRPYAVRGERSNGKSRVIRMHRQIIGAQHGETVDHINRDTLDNRRSNLRIVNRTVSSINRNLQSNNRTGYRGVTWRANRWVASIGYEGNAYYLGRFRDIEEAARAYDEAARRLHGEFAVLNFPEEVAL